MSQAEPDTDATRDATDARPASTAAGGGLAGQVPELSVVVPMNNEADNVLELHERLTTVLSELGITYELVFVDDGSTDTTFAKLRALVARDTHLTALRLKRNFGQTAALAAGFQHSAGKIIISMDGDLQDHPEDIPLLLDKVAEGYDLVSGWRKDRAESLFLRRIPSLVANKLMALISGVRLHDFGTTFKAYRREVIENIELYGELHRFIPALASWEGIAITEVVTRHSPRSGGQSHYGISRTYRVLLDLLAVKFLVSYVNRPLRFFGSIGLFLFCIGLGVALLITILYYFGDIVIHDNLGNLMFAMLNMVVGLQLVAMGLSLEVSSRIYHHVSGKKTYSIRQVLRSKDAS